jgi:hypothetical protein
MPLVRWEHPSELYHRTGSRSPYLRGLECDRDREIQVHGLNANGFYTDCICYIPASLCIPKPTLKQPRIADPALPRSGKRRAA